LERKKIERLIIDRHLSFFEYFLFLAIPFRQLQRPDRLLRQSSRQSECDGSLLGDFISNTSQPMTSTILNSNAEKKMYMSTTVNATDLRSVSTTNPLGQSSNMNIDDRLSHQIFLNTNSDQTKGGDRATRKECYRLGRRKLLFEQRRKASDYALFFAMIGLLFMVLEQELTMAKVYDKVEYS
jgi:hypothetical protein